MSSWLKGVLAAGVILASGMGISVHAGLLGLEASQANDRTATPDRCGAIANHPASVRLVREDMPVYYDHSKSAPDITRLGGEAMAGGTGRGLTQYELHRSYSVAFDLVHVPGGVCITPDAVRGSIGYSVTTVYVERDYRDGSCQFKAVKTHEDGHVRINRTTLDTAYPRVVEALRAGAEDKAFPLFASDADQAKALGLAVFASRVDPEMRAFEQERDTAHRLLDSPESYRATFVSCPSW